MTLGELVSAAVSHQKLKIMKTNHSIVQKGAVLKKQKSNPARTVIQVT